MVAVADYRIGPKENKREFYSAIYSQLDRDRKPFDVFWQDLNQNILPYKAKFLFSPVNQPEIRNQGIINGTPITAARVLGEGMNAGITSQARPWFRLTTADEERNRLMTVKTWLHEVTARMISVFGRSNFYDVTPGLWKEGGVYGTSAIGADEDAEDVVFFQQFPIGSFWIGDDSKGRARVFFRRFKMTVRQIIQKFGKRTKDGKLDSKNLSQPVIDAYENGRLQDWIDVTHVIMPNDAYNPQAIDAQFKAYTSCYFETGEGSWGTNYIGDGDKKKYLLESGYDQFPIFVFRWEVNGEDTYASGCPGMIVLGDCKGLQKMESMKLQAIEKKVKPPMNAPTSMRNQKLSILPAALNFTNQQPGQQGFTPTYQVNFDITELREEIVATESRINEGFYKQIFLALTMDDRLQRATAEEVRAIKLEQFTVLGSVLERANIGVLNPVIDYVFAVMMKQGLLPPPPRELLGMPLRVEYLSVLAQAQKLSGTGTMRQFMGDIIGLAQSFPQAADKINVDQFVDDLAESYQVSPKLVYDDQQVSLVRRQQARMAQAEQMMAAMNAAKQGASAAKDLSQASLDGNTVLSNLANRSAAGQLVPQ